MAVFDYIQDAIYYGTSLDSMSLLRVFWFFAIFDMPRYILTDTYILLVVVFQKLTTKKDPAFLERLQVSPPLVSVIIPALNEEETIAWTIRSLSEQSYQNFELIIVDDGSTDRTHEICMNLSREEHVHYFRFEERAGKSAVLNHGLKHANGEYIVFVDSDTTFNRDSIFELLQQFADPAVGGASGNLRASNASQNLLTTLQQIEYTFSISIGRRIRSHLNILPIISGAFGGFRKDLISLSTIGGHEPGPGNDSDLAIRIRKQGYRIVFIPEAICLTNVPTTLGKLMKQRQRWDRNIIKNRIKKHKNVFNPFQKQFRIRDAISFVDSIFYHVVLAGITAFYILDLAINFPELLPFILPINYVLYFAAEFYELIISVILSGRTKDLWFAVYLPLYNPYKIFLKFVRLIAYVQEFFFNYSKKDPFAPYKVRQRMIEW